MGADVMTTMQVDVVSSEELIFSGVAEYVVAPGSEGELGIYPNHISLINKLIPGVFCCAFAVFRTLINPTKRVVLMNFDAFILLFFNYFLSC